MRTQRLRSGGMQGEVGCSALRMQEVDGGEECCSPPIAELVSVTSIKFSTEKADVPLKWVSEGGFHWITPSCSVSCRCQTPSDGHLPCDVNHIPSNCFSSDSKVLAEDSESLKHSVLATLS